MKKIFVNIASYKDAECQWTVKNLFERAKHPGRISIGICWQSEVEAPDSRVGQVRIAQYHPDQSHGCSWARAEAQKLWAGEEYTLVIDAHMRFIQDWDDILINMLESCPGKPILSASLPGYEPGEKYQDVTGKVTFMQAARLSPLGSTDSLVHIHGGLRPLERYADGPFPTPFVVGNFIFARSSTFLEVPIDPYYFFYGEEIAQSVRFFTHGYDIYQPNIVVAYHQWLGRDKTPRDYRSKGERYRTTTMPRLLQLFAIENATDPQNVIELDKYGLGNTRPIAAYWTYAGIDLVAGTIQDKAKKGEWSRYQELMSKKTDTPRPVSRSPEGAGRIFVSIASYRDPECQWTVKDLFEKAANPDSIFVGICWQYDLQGDKHCFEIPYSRPDQVRVIEVNYTESQGVCWAREKVQTLWQGEEYFLQIDSHMRFVKDWDKKLFAQLKACDSKKSVISCNPPDYTPPDTLPKNPAQSVRRANPFDGPGDLRCASLALDKRSDKPLPGAFLAAGFLFGSSDIIKDVPYDPYLYFNQEEITLALRLYTHGYDLFSANETILYHLYYRDSGPGNRPLHWRDVQAAARMQSRALKRFNHLTGYKDWSSDPEVTIDLEKYGLGKTRSIEQYQEWSGVDFKNKIASERALKCKFIPKIEVYRTTVINIPANNNAAPPPKPKDTKPRIFVQIASYRDTECQWTIKDLFDKAKHPGRIFAGVCWQYDPEEDAKCFEVPSPYPDQVRVNPYHWKQSGGVCWARSEAQKLYDGEEYVLMIDSHMRFVQDWDEKMIAELALCPSPKPVISCHPAAYTPPDQLAENPRPTILRAHPFNPHGEFRCKGDFLDRRPEKPLPGAFLAAGYIFSKGSLVKEVPYDPMMYFTQEEISLAARMYTSGWDIYSSPSVLLYHYYIKPGDKPNLHWSDHKDWGKLQSRGQKRLNHLLGYEETDDPEALQDFKDYGLGKARTLAQYEAHAGLNFKKREVYERGLRCAFIPDLDKYRDRPIFIPEIDQTPAAAPPFPTVAPTQAPTAAPIAAPAPTSKPVTPLSPITPCDFIPFFTLPDQGGKWREIQNYSGRPVAFFYLPIKDRDKILEFFRALGENSKACEVLDFHRIYLFAADTPEVQDLETAFGLKSVLWCDKDRAMARAFGIEGSAETVPYTVLTDANLKVTHTYRPTDFKTHFPEILADIKSIREKMAAKPLVLSQQAPIILVPNALSPELCAELVEYWKAGKQYKGSIGINDGVTVNNSAKRRTDTDILDLELLRRVDAALSKSAFPEIRKVSGWEVGFRERYKIGCYTATEQGYYTTHRDTGVLDLTYRRYSMSLCIGGEYEGGTLEFTEYPGVQYKLQVGMAALFPSCLMHMVNPVTSGIRYVLLSFMYGDAEDARRHERAAEKGQKPPSTENKILTELRFPGMGQSMAYTQSSNAVATPAFSFPDPQLHVDQPFNIQILSTGAKRHLTVRKDVPEGVLIIDDYLERPLCDKLARYADAQAFTKLNVVDHEKSDSGKVATKASDGRVTDHVNIDGMSGEILSLFNDVYCNRLSPFYKVNFEWYERPQILRYSAGGKYNQHADADHWVPETKKWERTQDRDYSVLVYLNDEYGGGELEFTNFKYKVKPTPGMLIGFPSGHQYLHAALPTTSGTRYVIVSWAGVIGGPRVRDKPPYASVFVRQKRF